MTPGADNARYFISILSVNRPLHIVISDVERATVGVTIVKSVDIPILQPFEFSNISETRHENARYPA